jgi:hypothetical protein
VTNQIARIWQKDILGWLSAFAFRVYIWALEMRTEYRGPIGSVILRPYQIRSNGHRLSLLIPRTRYCRRQETGYSMACQVSRNPAKPIRFTGHYIIASTTMNMNVDEARNKQ